MDKKLVKIVISGLTLLFILSFSTCFAQTATAEDTNYQKAKEAWQKRKEELQTRKETLTDEAKNQDLLTAKTMVLRSIDRAIAKLERIEKTIQNLKAITDERKTKLVADLDAQIAALKDLKTKVDAATTKDELKTTVGETKNKFIDVSGIVKKIVAEILASHIDKVLEKLTTIASKLETQIAALKTKEQDVAALETTLKEAKDLITQATTKNKAGDWKEARKLAEQARAKLIKLVGDIKAANAKLKGGENASE